MSTQFAKPENALKRAEELVSINNKPEALNVLHSVITSKRFRTWQPGLEQIMLKYLSLCVELRKGKMAKDGLHQYRVTCQQYNINSLETVVKAFLEQAEERAREAQSKADKITLDIEDLEAEESLESVMLSSVSGEDTKDRTDREIVTPWLKFLWETYRTVLDILRNNNKLEHLYQITSQQAFNFCLKYKRHTEFRRLAEMLRTHLANIGKYSNQAQAVNLNLPESLQLHLETRFAQYNAAAELELWQECFRSIEDIHGLLVMAVTKKPAPKIQMIATYYQKLAEIFFLSENYVYHAYAINKFFNLSKTYNKSATEEELRLLASTVLLATMSIPIEIKVDIFDAEVQMERDARMSVLLSLSNVPITPKREMLLEELNTRQFNNLLLPELKDLYALMDKKYNPLQFCNSIKPKLDFLSSHPVLKRYTAPIKRLMVIKLLQQLARVYDVMKISEFSKLIYFAKFHELEQVILESVKKKYVDLRIDHQNGVLVFKGNSLESGSLHNQLSTLAKNLQSALNMLQPPAEASASQKKKEMYAQVLKSMEHDREVAQKRRDDIEARKLKIDEELKEKSRKEEEERRKKLAEQERLEQERLQEAAQERERNRKKREEEEKKRKELETFTTMMSQRTDIDPAEISKIDTLDPDLFIQKRIEKHEKEQLELAKKLKKIAKNLDWIERAKLKEEKPLFEKYFEEQHKADETYQTERIKLFLQESEQKWKHDFQEKSRLDRMVQDKNKFESIIMKKRQEEYEKLKAEREERLTAKKAKLLEERQRRQKEEEEKRAEQEKVRKQREEEERKKKEEDEKKRKEDEERQRKLAEVAEKQRKREEEVLRRQMDEGQRDEPRRDERPRELGRRDSERDSGVWRRDDREPPRRDDREPAPRRDDWGRRDDREPPRRDDFGRRDEPRRDDRDVGRDRDWRRDEPRRDDRDRRPFERRDDREPPRRDDREPPRRDDRDWPRRDDRDVGRRDEPPRRDDREPPRRDDREPPRRDDRDPGRRDDFGRRDEPRRDDRDVGRDRDWRRDEPRRDDRDRRPFERRDDREPPRRDDRDSTDRDLARRDDRPSREEPRRDDRPPRRDEPESRRDDRPPRDEPRRDDRPPRRDDRPPRGDDRPPRQEEKKDDGEDEGFTTVRRKQKR